MTPLTFAQAGRRWLDSLPKTIRRNGRPLSDNSIRIYKVSLGRLSNHLGEAALPVTNKMLREYVAAMRAEGYSGSSIVGDLNVCKLAQESLTSDDGDPIYPMRIRHDFVLTPEVVAENTPCATTAHIERALAESGQIAGIVAVASGAGLRISEILALSGENTGANDCLDFEQSMIHVRTVLKTPAAKRDIPIPSELVEFLKPYCNSGPRVFDLSRSEIYRQLSKLNLPPCHSYRRFRITHCRKSGMSEELLKYLAGHSNPGVTNRYSRAIEDEVWVRDQVERVGLGFPLPRVQSLTEELVAV